MGASLSKRVGVSLSRRVGVSLTRATGGAAPATVPDAPAAPDATKGARSVLVEWVAPDDGGSAITGYEVEGEARGSASVGVTLSTTITSLWSGESNRFRVRAINSIGAGAWSDWSNAVVPFGCPLFLFGRANAVCYHALSTTPNEDGAISAIADITGNDRHFTQGTGGRQPTRDDGRILFDGSDDNLNTTDATVLGWGDQSSSDLTWMLFGAVTANPAESVVALGHNATISSGSRFGPTTLRANRLRKGSTASNSANGTLATDGLHLAQFPSGTTTGATGYVDGELTVTVSGTATLSTPVIATIGAWNDAGALPTTMSVRAFAAIAAVMTSDEKLQAQVWSDAGCPMS